VAQCGRLGGSMYGKRDGERRGGAIWGGEMARSRRRGGAKWEAGWLNVGGGGSLSETRWFIEGGWEDQCMGSEIAQFERRGGSM
jgi:hypothetical protein